MGASQSSPDKSTPPQQNRQLTLPRGASPRNASHFSWRAPKKSSRANQAELPFGERLVAAAEDGDMNSLQQLHAGGADVNTAGPFGRTPLLAACRHGRTSMVKWLLTVHADPNQTNDAGVTPLHMAAAHDHVRQPGNRPLHELGLCAHSIARGLTALTREHRFLETAQPKDKYLCCPRLQLCGYSWTPAPPSRRRIIQEAMVRARRPWNGPCPTTRDQRPSCLRIPS